MPNILTLRRQHQCSLLRSLVFNSSHIAVVGCQQNMMAGSSMKALSKPTCAPNVRHISCPFHYAVTYDDAMACVPGFQTQHVLAERMHIAYGFDRVASRVDVIGFLVRSKRQ